MWHWGRSLAALTAGLTGALLTLAGLHTGAVAQTPITVDTTSAAVDFGGAQQVADLPGPDGRASLPEATIASTNTTGPDLIGFAIPTDDPGFSGTEFVIRYEPATRDDELVLADAGTTLDATTQPGGFPVVLQGTALAREAALTGLNVEATQNTVRGLTIAGYAFGLVASGAGHALADTVTRDNLDGYVVSGDDHLLTGVTASGNDRDGIATFDVTGAVIDQTTSTGNGADGIHLADDVGAGTLVRDSLTSGNGQFGVFTSGSGMLTRNTITGNGAEGVLVTAGPVRMTDNSIVDNGGLGIDLFPFGVDKNDGQDKDSGANAHLNFPVLRQVDNTTAETVVEGVVPVPEPATTTVEIYVSDTPDSSGHGEGATLVGTATPADAKGRFTATLPGGLAGRWLTATAIDAEGNTSEFSEAIEVATARN